MKSSVLVGLLALAAFGFVAWRVFAMSDQPVSHFGILRDPSGSYTESCDVTVGLAEQALASSKASTKSRLATFRVG